MIGVSMDLEEIFEKHKKLRKGFAYPECGGCQFRIQKVCSGLEKVDYCRLFCDGGYTTTPSYEWLQHCLELRNEGIEPYNQDDISECV